MSISLKSLHDQVQGLKTSGLSVVSQNIGSNGYVEFSNGLIINWGDVGYGFGGKVSFAKPYKSFAHVLSACVYGAWASDDFVCVTNINTSGFNFPRLHGSTAGQWMAIGYLITNRIIGWVM